MRIFFSSWMRELDEKAIHEIGIPSIVLMERAALEAARILQREFPSSRYPHCLVLAGKGNNGGDGLAIGRILSERGYQVHFLIFHPGRELTKDAQINLEVIEKLSLPVWRIDNAAQIKRMGKIFPRAGTLLIDALFGTGVQKPIRDGIYSQAISWINDSGLPVASMDVPSGLSEHFLPQERLQVNATVTVTFGGLKWALLNPDGNPYGGRIHVVDIGIPQKLLENKAYYLHLLSPEDFSAVHRKRSPSSHKGNFGHVLVIAGSYRMPGAGLLSAFSALKTGAGLVTAAVPPKNRVLYVKAHPELMTLPYKNWRELENHMNDGNTILAGPGLGNCPETAELVRMLVQRSRSCLILDADALNAVAEEKAWLSKPRKCRLVLTPHHGEFSRLTGLPVQEILKNRMPLCRDFARSHRLYLVLKGHHTLIADPEGQVYINQTGNPGMATAGSGDVLSGMIAGFLAQCPSSEPILPYLCAAVFLHGYAGDLAVRSQGELGLSASDIMAMIPDSIQRIHEFQSPFSFS